jgi:hypothetical protein
MSQNRTVTWHHQQRPKPSRRKCFCKWWLTEHRERRHLAEFPCNQVVTTLQLVDDRFRQDVHQQRLGPCALSFQCSLFFIQHRLFLTLDPSGKIHGSQLHATLGFFARRRAPVVLILPSHDALCDHSQHEQKDFPKVHTQGGVCFGRWCHTQAAVQGEWIRVNNAGLGRGRVPQRNKQYARYGQDYHCSYAHFQLDNLLRT